MFTFQIRFFDFCVTFWVYHYSCKKRCGIKAPTSRINKSLFANHIKTNLYKLPYKKEIRRIREVRQEFERNQVQSYTFEDRQQIDSQVDVFFSETNLDIQILWYSVNREFLKRYPHLDDEYTFLSNVYTTITFIEYINDYETKSNARINKRLANTTSLGIFNTPITCKNKHLAEISKILHNMIAKYQIDKTYMIELAMKVIGRKINDCVITYEK